MHEIVLRAGGCGCKAERRKRETDGSIALALYWQVTPPNPFGLSCNILTIWISFSPLRDVLEETLRLCVEGGQYRDITFGAEQELVDLRVITEQCSAERTIPKTTKSLVSHGFCAFDIALAIFY